MLVNRSVNSKFTAIVTLLHVLVVINIYNVVIIQFNDDKATHTLLVCTPETIQIIILSETIAFICMIVLNATQNTSSIIQGMKYSVMIMIYLSLLFDLILVFEIANELLYKNQLDEFWKKRNEEKFTNSNEKLTAPARVYFYVAGVLVFYFVIKLYALCAILCYAKKFFKGEIESVYFGIIDDIGNISQEQNRPTLRSLDRVAFEECRIPITPPPQYDECGIETNLPPSYDVALE